MLSIFAFPKPFRGHIGVIQRNAISSWKHLGPQNEVFLFGDEEGTATVAAELGVKHVPDIRRNEFGTPLLSDVFARGERLARHDIHGYVNCDIILDHGFQTAVQRISAWRRRFLMIGECLNLDVTTPIAFDDPNWERDLLALARDKGQPRGPLAIDYFVFPRNLYGVIPPFALGRAMFDNWLIWRARNLGAVVVDATSTVLAIHQNHNYSHVAGGRQYTLTGEEAMQNLAYAGGRRHRYGFAEATHRISPLKIVHYWPGYLRLNQAKLIAHDLFWAVMTLTRPLRHPLGLRASTVQRIRALLRRGHTR